MAFFAIDSGTATSTAPILLQTERRNKCANTMLVTKSIKLERILLHSMATSMLSPGIESTKPS